MPDPALEQTESQFFELLSRAAGEMPVFVTLYSLPGIPRGERAQKHLAAFYTGTDEVWESRVDGAIVTGTEPHEWDLRKEPYWRVLTGLLDWAAENTSSTVLSCLAAHAGVLHSDGIERHPMPEKRVGIFEARRVSDHPLTNGVPGVSRFPHSRWNEVREGELTSGGYTVLTKSAEAGVDSFIKQRRQSLFLHFQGHPEYGADTLLKEYRRDVKRFLRRELERYPTMPHGYFSAAAAKLLSEFRKRALEDRREELIENFPEAEVAATLGRTWETEASAIYSNWLRYLSAARTTSQRFPVAALRRAVGCGRVQKRSAAL
jgi:homoserine O-succinyltransferase